MGMRQWIEELEEASERIDLLVEAIRKIAVAQGIIVDGHPINGPQALMFADDVVNDIINRQCGSPA